MYSSLLWLQGQDCSPADCPFERYSNSNSSTAIATDYLLNISYAGGGGAFGKFYQDTVSLAGLTVPHQFVGSSRTNGSITSATAELQQEGLMGLGFPTNITTTDPNNKTLYDPFVFQLVKNNLIPEPIFSYALGPADILADGGELVLGGINPEKYTGEINYVPVAPQTLRDNSTAYLYWQSIAQDLRIVRNNSADEKQTDIVFTNSSSTYLAVMDTGTTLSYMSANFSASLYQSVTGLTHPTNISDSSLWEIDCAFLNSTDFMQVSLTHNSDGSAEDKPLKLRAPVSSFVLPYNETTCAWSILVNNAIHEVGDSQILLGQNFLRNFYVVNNMSVPSMGFAASANYSGEVIW